MILIRENIYILYLKHFLLRYNHTNSKVLWCRMPRIFLGVDSLFTLFFFIDKGSHPGWNIVSVFVWGYTHPCISHNPNIEDDLTQQSFYNKMQFYCNNIFIRNANISNFRTLKCSKLEYFRALKCSNLEHIRALKFQSF